MLLENVEKEFRLKRELKELVLLVAEGLGMADCVSEETYQWAVGYNPNPPKLPVKVAKDINKCSVPAWGRYEDGDE